MSVNQNLSPGTEGSYAGGARLYIRGTISTQLFVISEGVGFADHDSGTNRIFVGPNECSIIDYYSTTSFLVCIVPPTSDQKISDQPVKLLVNNKIWATCATDCTFRYRPCN